MNEIQMRFLNWDFLNFPTVGQIKEYHIIYVLIIGGVVKKMEVALGDRINSCFPAGEKHFILKTVLLWKLERVLFHKQEVGETIESSELFVSEASPPVKRLANSMLFWMKGGARYLEASRG